jgi:hypothetical protein
VRDEIIATSRCSTKVIWLRLRGSRPHDGGSNEGENENGDDSGGDAGAEAVKELHSSLIGTGRRGLNPAIPDIIGGGRSAAG